MTRLDDRRHDAGPAMPLAKDAPVPPARRPLTAAQQRSLRRRLFWWSLPLTLIALTIGVKLVSLPIVAQAAIADYRTEDYSGSELSAAHLLTANAVEPWIAWFDRGTAAAAGRDWVQGTEDLGKALTLAPTEETACIVRVNLARAYETQADEYLAAGYVQGAINLYDTAKRIVDAGTSCSEVSAEDNQSGDGQPSDGTDQQQSPGENLQDTGDRIDEKRQAATAQRDGAANGQGSQDPSGGGEGSNGTGDSGLGGKIDRLQDTGQDAQRDKSTEDAKNRGRNNDNGSFTERPW